MRHSFSRRSLLGTAAMLTLAGCSGDTWLGEKKAPPLPGERKSVLLIEEQVRADPRLADLKITLPVPQRNPDWPQSGGNPQHAMQHLSVAETIGRAWRADIGTGSGSRTRLLGTPVAAGGRVFAVDGAGVVSAYEAGNGGRVWSFGPKDVEEMDRLQGGACAFDGGRLYVATGYGTVFAVDAATGRELWRQPLRAPMRAAPTVVDGRVLVPTADSQLYALRGDNGEIQWRHAGLFEQAAILGGASPAVAGNTVVATYPSGEVVALSLDNGQPLWNETVLRPRRTLAIGAITDIVGDPVIDDGKVIVAGASGEMAAFDLDRGERQWSVDVTSTQTPWVAGDFIYVLTERNEVVCMLRQGGRVRWVSPLAELVDPKDPDSRRIRWVGPILASDRLLLASSEGEVASVSPYTGEVLGRTSLAGAVSVPPIVADGTVYFLTDGGELLAYR
ncbi:PQQ-binding-like beta-propeller repeat protein [Benzoatithermus flavus]|uniref:PQQ-binding-like beta-propeller repeat protein n=1 Tax=Benzoatithermus flavus TaxID=3108223 RepID=A0ABU8XRH3_9PROT